MSSVESVMHPRRLKSYVLRSGRATASQNRAFENYWDKFGLQCSAGPLDIDQCFAREQAFTVFEIGFGMGQSLAEMAQQSPDTNFIGVEVHHPGVGKLLSLLGENGSENARIYEHDAVEVLEQCIADNVLDRVQIYFPDPWHKKRHHKRRLINPEFVNLLCKKLKSGAQLHLATDWEHYAEQMMEVMSLAEGFENIHGEYAYSPERPEFRPETKFERRGERLGHGVWDLQFNKR